MTFTPLRVQQTTRPSSAPIIVTRLYLRVRAHCANHMTNQTEIARQVGTSASHLSEYINLRRPIPFMVMRQLCELFTCAPSDILGVAEEGKDVLVLDEEVVE